LEDVRLAQQHKREEKMGPYRKFQMKASVLAMMVPLLTVGLVACASHETRPLTPQSTDAYLLKQTVAGVIIAVEPLATKEKAEAAFTVDLTEQGYAPILVVMENRSTDNILLLKDNIELVDSRGNVLKPISANVMAEKFEHNKMAYALLGFGIFSYMSAEEANKKMREDWNSKELPAEKVLIPNRKVHGVVYFQLGPGLATLPNATLRIPLQNARTGENYSVDLRIAGK